MKDNIDKLIGNTPLIKINYKYKDKLRSIYAKLEYYNLTGSIKDRMAYYIIKEAKKNGMLKDRQAIVEATSGNTGISISALGAYFKHEVHIFMPDWVSIERRKLMELYGAKIYLVSRSDGGFQEAIRRADEYAKIINGYRPNQFDNEDNVMAHYKATVEEILSKVNATSIVLGVGTGGTLMGIGKRLKEIDSSIKVLAMEPKSLPLLSEGINIGSHKIEGIGDDFIPNIVDKNIIDEVVVIDDVDAINMAKMLASELGLGVGISSGANFLASALANDNKTTVTVFADDNKKYLSTNLVDKINTDNLISKDIELVNYEVL
jgi:Cysteine synthase